MMAKAAEDTFGWRKAPFREKKQATLERERVIEQLNGRLLHCIALKCEALEQLDLCITSLAFFESRRPGLGPGGAAPPSTRRDAHGLPGAPAGERTVTEAATPTPVLRPNPSDSPRGTQAPGNRLSTGWKDENGAQSPNERSQSPNAWSKSPNEWLHMRSHSGEGPYACTTKAFSDPGSLTKHMRTRSGKRPYACKVSERVTPPNHST
ncbi:hypothetical protein T484DRAFT_3529979 [Baffinella frigidus]|nr:hypothetical protein T484DRAFT_3529979 [Cryptophyta sp. CCMP2293]